MAAGVRIIGIIGILKGHRVFDFHVDLVDLESVGAELAGQPVLVLEVAEYDGHGLIFAVDRVIDRELCRRTADVLGDKPEGLGGSRVVEILVCAALEERRSEVVFVLVGIVVDQIRGSVFLGDEIVFRRGGLPCEGAGSRIERAATTVCEALEGNRRNLDVEFQRIGIRFVRLGLVGIGDSELHTGEGVVERDLGSALFREILLIVLEADAETTEDDVLCCLRRRWGNIGEGGLGTIEGRCDTVVGHVIGHVEREIDWFRLVTTPDIGRIFVSIAPIIAVGFFDHFVVILLENDVAGGVSGRVDT